MRGFYLREKLTGLTLFTCLVWTSACDSRTASVVDASDFETTASLCAWPAAFDSTDASVGECRAARMFLACAGSNGGGRECLSDNPVACPGPNPTPGVTYSDCKNQCQPGEYALACGGPGPAHSPQPPDGCRILPPNPGGVSFSCCPCGL